MPWKNASYSNAWFESISVGVALAIKSEKEINMKWIKSRIYSSDFLKIVSSDAANNYSKLKDRILYVYKLLVNEKYTLEWKYDK